ncbi:hypothetical protein BLA29_014790 [Euroglyphus maynei]|uniref:Uncharacterized protein n=1 Tax=Euroglyphus maynei TaxID=6958 RepID=A0A1Y3BN26_EURMA|nr:hypothetical protein BLA29_014790 [Euroglyphus maynei]
MLKLHHLRRQFRLRLRLIIRMVIKNH